MELEEAIKDIKVWLDFPVWFIHSGKDEDFLRRIDKSAIETLLNHLTKQEKMIEYMANWINDHEDPFEGCHENGKCENELIPCKECIKQYFEKKAEESDKNVND